MPGTTTTYGWPYPIAADALATWRTTAEDFAEQVESTITGFGGIASPGSWIAFPFDVGTDVGGAYQAMEYRKVGTAVTLRGVMGGLGGGLSAATVLGTLPAGFRPPATEGFIVRGGTAADEVAAVDVQADGDVVLITALAAGSTLWLSGIQFFID